MKLKLVLAAAAFTAVLTTGAAVMTAAASTESGRDGHRIEQTQETARAIINAKGPQVFPHSVDYNRQSKNFVVGSLKHSTISTVGLDGTVRTLVDDPSLVSVQAVRVDRDRHRVLAGNVDYGLADRSAKDTTFRVAGVGSYDLTSGKRRWYADLAAVAADGKQHLIADVTVAPDGTAYAVDQLTPTVFRIDRKGRASVLLRSDLLKGTVDVPNFLSGIGMTAVAWTPQNHLIIAKADGSLVRVPVNHPERARKVELSKPLAALTAGIRVLPDGSIAAVSSGLLSGKPAQIQRVRPCSQWKTATVTVTDTVTDPVTSGIAAGPKGSTFALSGGLPALLMGKPNNGFTLTSVAVD
ncbi:hypothetical protein SLUN_20800 [Streptomyces lunaelactis]|uniref:SMP-30/Gluconolactonase/LRE-like region domain-containing protein n=1 Tax=Streptomyces lunaelactis TaxID=1535768 RepID=A0A2R4T549_9ACTN|nr:hypothetical protein [Streptomyces lunaelactis]AVZ74242.1 hypothetical protein SLUN_20800 [Streptomyces lunaelactis]NUK85224.1 hypothetical protein [Streptomyces lunaelactis]